MAKEKKEVKESKIKLLGLDISEISLIISNLIPLFGVIFFNWNVFMVLILYWCESAVIGFYNVLKIITAVPRSFINWFLAIFFCVHFGGFMMGHLVFLIVFFAITSFKNNPIQITQVSNTIFGLIISITIALISLFISHGISFYSNYIRNGEYKKTFVGTLFFAPYKRIILMHITIIAGGFFIMFIGLPTILIALFIIAKTAIDLIAHRNEHSDTRVFKEHFNSWGIKLIEKQAIQNN